MVYIAVKYILNMSDDIPTFGGANELDAVAATSSFLIIIGCAVLLETIFESIHIQTHETPYYDMVSAIEKELMISGFLAFAFNTVAASIGLLGDHWLIAINFADTAMPLSAAIYGSIGLMLIVRSVKHAQLWRRAANIRLAQLLMNYYEQPNELLDRIHRFFFMSVEDEEVKFRILHNIFCEAYCIQRKAFAFDEYCQKVYEKYLLNLVTISPLSEYYRTDMSYLSKTVNSFFFFCIIGWLLLCAFIACNYIRMHMRMDVYNCSGVDEDDEHHICQIENSTTLFVISGFGLLIVTGITYVMTITYIWRLMATKGIVSKSDFATFLQLLESNDNFNPDAAKMNLDELTVSIC